MSAKVDKIVKVYKSLAQNPSLLGAYLCSNGVVNSVWSQRNIEKGKTTKFTKTFVLDKNLKKIAETQPLDITDEVLSRVSKSEKFRAVLRENDSKQFLEIWHSENLIRCVDLNALDVHGNVYADVEFGSFEWSPDERKVMYVAEKKVPKSDPFYKRKGNNEEGSGDSPKPRGEEFVFVQDWGEQLVGKKKSVIAQYDVETDSVEILSGIPDNKCVAQPKYNPDGSGVVGVAYETEPRKLGLIYCSNRASSVFSLDFKGNYVEVDLVKDDLAKAVKSPIFTPDGKHIIWLQRESGGPHATCMSLVKTEVPLAQKSDVKTVLEAVNESVDIGNGTKFYGLYNNGFPRRCWLSNNQLILSTNQKYTINTYIINIDNGKVTEIPFKDGSQLILDAFDGKILVARKNCRQLDYLAIGEKNSDSTFAFENITQSKLLPNFENIIYNYMDFEVLNEYSAPFNAIYIGPKSAPERSVPLIVWPHGGPHSAFANYLMMEAALFLQFNYAILLVNYRGSLGFGKKWVDFLPGKVGEADVADCVQAVDEVLLKRSYLDPDALCLVGGSHGGFLVTHLSGQYPDKFKCVVARNPVTDIASMSVISDIPDWCYVEAGMEYTQKGEINRDILVNMREKSPIVHAHKVKAPTLLQIGSKDLRVPSQQGTDYYHRLKANGVKAKINLYDDNHPLGTVPNEMDNIINSLLWIEESIGRTE
ncbi:unnamed protein product [Brassicogethes aeneus]|uniref:Acylamino-acid-releasing enzyme n=1 Tax=Brassicogethes aeneus TaxID=1431903 RepID=A0A9P0B303_BRAAE|nr:unnamed protein product [Brassicogethes aeneus]